MGMTLMWVVIAMSIVIALLYVKRRRRRLAKD